MSWHEYIHGDSSILTGKPVIRGTRLSVAFLFGLLAEGWTAQEILENYPQLSGEALRAMFAFAEECTRDELAYALDNESTAEITRKGEPECRGSFCKT